MSPETMARLHAASFPRGWSVATFAELCANPSVCLQSTPTGFALARSVLDEAEILTLVVAPDARRQGHGAALLDGLLERLRASGIARVFLEVAEDNAAARALYLGAGFVVDGRRRGYYARPDDPARVAVDALLMSRALPQDDGAAVSPGPKG